MKLHKSCTVYLTCIPAPPHSFPLLSPLRWSDHEKAVGALARHLGFTQVSLSSEVMPMVRAVPRGYTVCADAYLTPKIRQYLKGFTSGFKGGLKVGPVFFNFLIMCAWLFKGLDYYKGIN